ncbi:MAG TPA: aminopeptidase N [Burkholderiaceae bacterium]|nr:aminopeptidase N [Burkholderiaceae bacterium]
MRNDQAVTIRRADYRPPDFLLDQVSLEFDLDPALTYVTATLNVRRNPVVGGAAPLRLDGEDLDLALIAVDGHALPASAYQVREDGLTLRLRTPSNRFQLKTIVRIKPARNTELMGLFVSNGNFFSQCEAEGFRRITFFPDRPDVMTKYRVTIRADKARYPVLLANGNLIEQGDLSEGRHYAIWDDPFAKPSYLFALVAGNLAVHEERFTRASGRDATLQIYVEHGNQDKTQHAMASLKRAIEWDERRYGLELDLDRFMIVASNDFNMGAMENKGLNIFNAKYILASPMVATDDDYVNVESIVGHEYFHNWTGNRVTCRDWFQLSLKEGLTVFRDQEFSADMLGDASSRAVKRIEDVRALRASQFPEDSGPMAHPVRPDSYQAISNFYTATVYEKGAEVVRMLQTLVGIDGFRHGMDLYFKRHDGQAVTCDDFVAAIADANGRDLTQFKRWYSQAGTPRVRVESHYDAHAFAFELTLSQSTRPTAGQSLKEPFHIPFAVGLITGDGRDMPLQLDGEADTKAGTPATMVLDFTQSKQTFRFINVGEQPVPSLLRNFSAPVIVEHRYSDAELVFLSAHDSDSFNRWEAGQRLAIARLMALTDSVEAARPLSLDDAVVTMLRATLLDSTLSPAFKAQALMLPAESFIGEQRDIVDPEAIRTARRFAMRELGQRLAADWQTTYSSLQSSLRTSSEYSPDPQSAGRRALRNLALSYLAEGDAEGVLDLAREQLVASTNMTDAQGALAVIVNSASPLKAEALIQLARVWSDQPLLMNKWFQLQATAVAHRGEPPVVERVRLLQRHPGFSLSNPNNVNALVRSFCLLNDAEFHRRDGSGYAFWADQVLALDKINPTIAARIARALDRWRKFTADRQGAMRAALEKVAGQRGLSRDVCEIVNKSLAN